MKRIVSYFTIFVLMMSILNIVSLSAPIQSYKEEIPIGENIVLTKVREFYATHDISYSYITADLNDSNISMDLIKSDKGVDIMDTVPNLATTNSDVVAILNADFFSQFSGNKGFALGMEVKNGELLQSNINPDTMASVYTDGERVDISYVNLAITLTAPNGEKATVRHLNKHTSYFGDILMYTSDFNGSNSPAPGGEVVEVVVSDGKITEFRRSMPSVKIPEDGCVFVVSEGSSMFFGNNFNVGDSIDIEYTSNIDMEKVKTAFGAGAMLVTNGVKNSTFSHVISGYNPRSALGIDKSGKKLILLAVDGRQTSSRGMLMSELSELMLSLGCYNAVNLDGGGSTNMQASTIWNSKLHPVNSPTENRRVINAVGLTYKPNQGGKTTGIAMKSDVNEVFIGHGVNITASAHDGAKRPVNNPVVLSSQHGTISGNTFIPNKSGYVRVDASCDGVYESMELYVVDKIAGIDTDSHLRLNAGDTKEIKIKVYDDEGRHVDVTDVSRFEITSSNPSVVSVSGRKLTANKNGNAIVTVSKDGVKTHVSVAVGYENFEYFESFSAPNGGFKSYPKEVNGSFLRSKSISGEISGKLSFDFTDETMSDVAMAAYYSLNDKPIVSGKEIKLQLYTENDFPYEICAQFIDSNDKIAIASFGDVYKKGEWQKLTAHVPTNAALPLKLDSIYVRRMPGEEGTEGAVYIDDLNFIAAKPTDFLSAPQNIYACESKIVDGQESVVFGYNIPAENTLYNAIVRGAMTKQVSQKNGIMIGGTNSFGVSEDSKGLYITLNTSKGGIRSTDPSQWEKLTSQISSTNKDNIFLISCNSLFGESEFENTVLMDYLASLDKRVAVITLGNRNEHKRIKGVDYFTLGVSNEEKADVNQVNNFSYLALKLSDKIEFDFKPCFTKK